MCCRPPFFLWIRGTCQSRQSFLLTMPNPHPKKPSQFWNAKLIVRVSTAVKERHSKLCVSIKLVSPFCYENLVCSIPFCILGPLVIRRENQQPHPIIHSAGKPEDFTSLAYGARVTSIVAHLGSVWIEWTVHVPLMIIIGYAVSLHIFKALYTKIDCPSPLSLPPVPEKYLEQQQKNRHLPTLNYCDAV